MFHALSYINSINKFVGWHNLYLSMSDIMKVHTHLPLFCEFSQLSSHFKPSILLS